MEPVGTMILAAVAGFAASVAPVREELWAPGLAALTAFCGGRALYEAIWGFPAWAAQVRASAPAGDALALLNRLEQGRPYGGFLTPAALGCFLIMTIPPGRRLGDGKARRAAGHRPRGRDARRDRPARDPLGLGHGGVGLGAPPRRPAGAASRPRASPRRPRRSRSRSSARGSCARMPCFRRRTSTARGGSAPATCASRSISRTIIRRSVSVPAGTPRRFRSTAEPGTTSRATRTIFRRSWRRSGACRSASRCRPSSSSCSPGRWCAGAAIRGPSRSAWRWVGRLRDPQPGRFHGVPPVAARRCGDPARPSRRAGPGRARASTAPAALAAWIALASAAAVVSAGSGLARDAMFDGANGGRRRRPRASVAACRAGTLAPWDADPPAARGVGPDGDGNRRRRRLGRRRSRRPARAVARGRPGGPGSRAAAAGDAPGAYADFGAAARLYPLHPDYAKQEEALADSLVKAAAGAPR